MTPNRTIVHQNVAFITVKFSLCAEMNRWWPTKQILQHYFLKQNLAGFKTKLAEDTMIITAILRYKMGLQLCLLKKVATDTNYICVYNIHTHKHIQTLSLFPVLLFALKFLKTSSWCLRMEAVFQLSINVSSWMKPFWMTPIVVHSSS